MVPRPPGQTKVYKLQRYKLMCNHYTGHHWLIFHRLSFNESFNIPSRYAHLEVYSIACIFEYRGSHSCSVPLTQKRAVCSMQLEVQLCYYVSSPLILYLHVLSPENRLTIVTCYKEHFNQFNTCLSRCFTDSGGVLADGNER